MHMIFKDDVDLDVPVLVVGAGGAGLTAAIMLADLGVEAFTIERHPSTSILPKAHILNVRTMEILDRHGLADEVYERGTPLENLGAATWYTSLGGDEPWSRQPFFTCDAWGGGALIPAYDEVTAYHSGNLPQMHLERMLRRHAEERGPGRVLFNHELESLRQDEDGVTATIVERDSGERRTVRAQYLIAADGGKTVGPQLGIGMVGPKPFVNMISIHFRADLSEYIQEDASIIRMIARPTLDGGWVRGGCIAMGPERWDRHSEEWRVSVTLPVGEHHADDYDETRAVADIRRQLELPDLEVEVLVVSRWLIESVVAERFQAGRVFLCGDAAHRHAPMGGLGLNTAIQDVHNLTWKLAAVAHGHAEPALLESYEAERLPVCRRNVEWATFNFYNHLAAGAGFGMLPGAPQEHNRAALEGLFAETPDGANRRARLQEFYWTVRREFQQLDVELGFDYAGSPAVVPDGTRAPVRDPNGRRYEASARPGHRLPHAWLTSGEVDVSTHHLLTLGGFLLLAGTGSDADVWSEAAAVVSAELDVEVVVHRVGPEEQLRDPTGAWAAVRGHGDDGAVLVRPDGHVAFRATQAGHVAASLLAGALRASLGRPTAGAVAQASHQAAV